MGEARLKGRRSRGVSPVIATIILSAVVITIGAAIWNYAQGAATIIANDYVNGTLDLLHELNERFTVEHASNKSDGSMLYIWIYNYGEFDAFVDVYANATHYNPITEEYEYLFSTNYTNFVVSEGIVKINIPFSSTHLSSGDYVAIKVHSRRQKNAYYKYYVS